MGKHYFLLQGEDLKEFKNHSDNIGMVGKRASALYLWTEKGALRHAKILDTDEAWEVYELLEETYFRAKKLENTTSRLSPQLQALINIEVEQKKLRYELLLTKNETAAVKEEVKIMKEIITINPKDDWRRETNAILSKVCRGLNNYSSPKDEAYKALEIRGGCKLNVRLNNLKARALTEGLSIGVIKKMNYLDVIANDQKLKEIYIAIVKEIAIKNGVKV